MIKLILDIPDDLAGGVAYARLNANSGMAQTVVVNDVEVPNPALHATDTAYLTARIQDVLHSWYSQLMAVPPPAPPAPGVISTTPLSVTMRQAQLALLGAGLLSQVNATIAAIPGDAGIAARITWDKSSTVERSNPLIAQLAGSLSLTTAQIDALFVAASHL